MQTNLISVNIWQSYKQKRDCLVHFLRLLQCVGQARKVHETTTLLALLVTLPNIHRIKKFADTLNNKPFLFRLLSTPPHLIYVATLLCNVLLMACFADTNVSQGNVVTYARCGGTFNIHLTANLLRNLLVKKICKSVKIWQNYGHESVAPFFGPPCTVDNSTSVSQWF